MSKYTVLIELDNAAFQPNENDGTDASTEVPRILRELADKVELFSFAHEQSYYPIKDINGNSVGKHGYEIDQ